MTSIVYLPVIENKDELQDLLSRAAWFLTFSKINKIYVPILDERLLSEPWLVAPGMDKCISERFSVLKDRLQFVLVKSLDDIKGCIRDSSIVLRWRKDATPNLMTPNTLQKLLVDKIVWRVDSSLDRMEGSFYIEVGLSLIENKKELLERNKEKFLGFSATVGHLKRAYILATGPSVWRYRLFDYSNAISIVCNSVILDDELMSVVRPKILVFADPIFHFGPSQYAAEFRKKVKESVEKYDCTIIIPFKYYQIFCSVLPELIDRVIAIPFEKDISFNFDLESSFKIKTTSNILTLLLVPLATTFAEEVGVLGCDGRPLKEDSYFWGHNQKTQINDKMSNIREIHPSFFAINYNDYYLEHCENLDAQFKAAEMKQKKIYSLGFSYIPALGHRMGLGSRSDMNQEKTQIKKVIILDPDAKSWSGHYMAYNEKLSLQLNKLDIDVQVICRKDIASEILDTRPNYFPSLSVHSWAVGNRKENREHIDEFELELNDALEKHINCFDESTILYMYCGSIEHAQVLARVVKKYPNLYVNINLFWLSFVLNEEKANEWKDFIVWLDEEIGKGKFVATSPTAELRNAVAKHTGCILPVAPHPSTGLSDDDFRSIENQKKEQVNQATYRVLFPSAPRLEKGYLASVECAKLLASNSDIQPVIRHAPTFSTPKELAKPLADLPSSIEIVEGELSDEEFLDLFKHVEISIIPYLPDAFGMRTSGLLIDSIYHGIPCVVLKDTWLGNFVSKYRCGEVVENCSARSLADGTMKIVANYEQYKTNALVSRSTHFSNNSWEVFGKFLIKQRELSLGGSELYGETLIDSTLDKKAKGFPNGDISKNLNIFDANVLYRQGSYSEAMESYLQLYQLRKLKMYADNALMAARKQGITSVHTIDELIIHANA